MRPAEPQRMLLLVNHPAAPTGATDEEKAMKRVATPTTTSITSLKRLTALAATAAALAGIGAGAPAASAFSTPPPKDGCTLTSTPTHSSASCTFFGSTYECYKNAAADPWKCYRGYRP